MRNQKDAISLISPLKLAKAIGSSESSLKRWLDKGIIKSTKTPGGHRRIFVSDAIEYIRTNRIPVVSPEELGIQLDNSVEAFSDFDFLDMLKSGEKDTAISFLINQFLLGKRISYLVEYPIRKALQFLGDSDIHEPTSIYQEHIATQISIAAINQLQSYISCKNRFTALSCCLENDPYILPPLSTSSVIKECHGKCTNIGPNTPIEMLFNLKESQLKQLDIMAISISQLEDPDSTAKDLILLSDFLGQHDVELILGGRLLCNLNIKNSQVLQLPTLNALDLYLKHYKKPV